MATLIWQRLRAHQANLVAMLIENCREQVPAAHEVLQHECGGDIAVFERMVGRVFELAPRMGTWSAEDLAEVRALAERWAGLLPVNDAIAFFQTAIWSFHVCLAQYSGPGDHAALWRLHQWTATRTPVLLETVVDAYNAAIGGRHDFLRRKLAESLLEGGPSEVVAGAEGLSLHDRYLLVVATPGGWPVLSDTDERAVRLEHSIEKALHDSPDVLPHRQGAAFYLLRPVGRADGAGDRDILLTPLIDQIRKGAEGVTVIFSVVGPVRYTELPSAAMNAFGVARLAAAARLSAHMVSDGDVLLERILAAERSLSSELARTIVGLSDNPELLHTLETFYENDLDRSGTASALNIHRRTLTYRLSRIAELTGMSPTSLRGIQLLSTALTAYHITRTESPADGLLPSPDEYPQAV